MDSIKLFLMFNGTMYATREQAQAAVKTMGEVSPLFARHYVTEIKPKGGFFSLKISRKEM